ncbi:uncharacterized protein ARMOST_20838 [Armillaria ostoyae]|uniref:Uncharacterized protein n=1 Tax=Armillaria ostoyae TaxID=47428 RepID=A0A284S8F0_ARMOS|nr:uncharacterized protein ARMOST_20838 [Armillaria ostoyae]
MSVTTMNNNAQTKWAQIILPLYHSIRSKGADSLDAFLYGLFVVYAVCFCSFLYTELGPPNAGPANISHWKRKALEMLAHLLHCVHVSESVPPPSSKFPSSQLSVIESLSAMPSSPCPHPSAAMAPINHPYGPPIPLHLCESSRSLHPLPLLHCAPMLECLSIETPAYAVMSKPPFPASNSGLVLDAQISMEPLNVLQLQAVQKSEDSQQLTPTVMMEDRLTIPQKQMKSQIYKVIKNHNPGEVNKWKPKVKEVVKPKRKHAHNALKQYMVLHCKNNPEFEKQLDIECANIPNTSTGKGTVNDHSGPDHGADGLLVDVDSSQPPQKSHKKDLNGLSVQVHQQVTQRLFDLEPCKVQEEMCRLYQQELQEIKEYHSQDPSHVDTKRVAHIILDLRALMRQIEDLLGMIRWSFSFVAGGLELDNDVPQTFVMNYGWNDARQDFHDFHPDFESNVIQIYCEFLDTIYTEEQCKEFQEVLQACRPKAQTEEESQVKEDGTDKPLSAEALAEEEAVLGAFVDIFGPLSGDNETSIHGDPDVQQMVATAIASAAINSEASAGQLAAPIFPNLPCFSDQPDLVLPPFGEASEGTGDPNNNPLPTGGALVTSSLFDINFFWESLSVPLGEELDTCCIPPEMWSEQWNPASLLPGTSEVNTDDLDLSFMIDDDASLFLPDGNHPTGMDITMADADDLNTVLDAGIALFDQNPIAELPNCAIFFSTPQPDDDTSLLGQSDSGYAVIPALLKELNGPTQTFSAQEHGGDIDKPTTT